MSCGTVSNRLFDDLWEGKTTTAPSQHVVWTKLTDMISDDAYAAGWDEVTDVAPSKNAVWDKIETLSPATHRHDGETLEHDGVNADGPTHTYNTTVAVTANQQWDFNGGIGNGGSALRCNDDIELYSTENTTRLHEFYRDDSTPGNSNILGRIVFQGRESTGGTKVAYEYIDGLIGVAASGRGRINFNVRATGGAYKTHYMTDTVVSLVDGLILTQSSIPFVRFGHISSGQVGARVQVPVSSVILATSGESQFFDIAGTWQGGGTGALVALNIEPTMTSGGSGGWKMLNINPSADVGTGSKYLAWMGIAGSEMWSIDNAGNMDMNSNTISNVSNVNNGGSPISVNDNLIISDGGTIGQAAGPLLTFDDSNNFLEITGCKVGLGVATPSELLELFDGNLELSTTANGLIRLQNNAVRSFGIEASSASDYIFSFKNISTGQFKLGVNTTTPSETCHIENPSGTSADLTVWITNEDTTNTSDALLKIETASAAAGDPYVEYKIGGVGSWYMGIDNSDSDKLKISRSLWGTEFSIDTAGNVDTVLARRTFLGGWAILVTNKTGANSVQGETVIASAVTANAVALSTTSDADIIGVFLESGIADGSEAWVVIAGIAEVKADATGFSKGDRVVSSTATAGRVEANNSPAAAAHFTEVGHAFEDAAANAVGKCNIHFL